MKQREIFQIIAAIVIFTIVGSFAYAMQSEFAIIPKVLFFSIIIILVSVFAKKLMAYLLDADVEHEIWNIKQWGLKPSYHFKKEFPVGIILPLIITLFSIGFIRFSAFLSYEARALKRRAAKRFGFYSFTEITEWHNALIGAAGIVAMFLLATISYFIHPSFEYLSKLAVFYAISNMILLPKLDGTQIFFGSRVLWTILAVISVIFGFYAIFII